MYRFLYSEQSQRDFPQRNTQKQFTYLSKLNKIPIVSKKDLILGPNTVRGSPENNELLPLKKLKYVDFLHIFKFELGFITSLSTYFIQIFVLWHNFSISLTIFINHRNPVFAQNCRRSLHNDIGNNNDAFIHSLKQKEMMKDYKEK